jgi:hypothetical protein
VHAAALLAERKASADLRSAQVGSHLRYCARAGRTIIPVFDPRLPVPSDHPSTSLGAGRHRDPPICDFFQKPKSSFQKKSLRHAGALMRWRGAMQSPGPSLELQMDRTDYRYNLEYRATVKAQMLALANSLIAGDQT